MSRRHRAEKRQVVPDIRYSSPLVAHLVNVIMKNGKKNLAQRIVYGAFEKVSEKLEKGDPAPSSGGGKSRRLSRSGPAIVNAKGTGGTEPPVSVLTPAPAIHDTTSP